MIKWLQAWFHSQGELLAKVADLEKDNRSLRRARDELATTNGTLRTQNAAAEDHIDRLEKQLSEALGHAARLQEEVAEVRGQRELGGFAGRHVDEQAEPFGHEPSDR